MSDTPERVWIKEVYNRWGQYGHWYAHGRDIGTEYGPAAHIEQLTATNKELEAKLTNQTHMISQVFALLDVTEETEDGRVFHPNQIRSSRVLDAEKLDALLAELRDTLTANDKENSYAE